MVEQRSHKPLVGSSILPAATSLLVVTLEACGLAGMGYVRSGCLAHSRLVAAGTAAVYWGCAPGPPGISRFARNSATRPPRVKRAAGSHSLAHDCGRACMRAGGGALTAEEDGVCSLRSKSEFFLVRACGRGAERISRNAIDFQIAADFFRRHAAGFFRPAVAAQSRRLRRLSSQQMAGCQLEKKRIFYPDFR